MTLQSPTSTNDSAPDLTTPPDNVTGHGEAKFFDADTAADLRSGAALSREATEILAWARERGQTADAPAHVERRRRVARLPRVVMDSSTWGPVPLDDLLSGNRPPISTSLLARVDGVCLLYAGRQHSFTGETESLKTWAALAVVAQELQAGHRVVIVDFEDAAETVVLDRLHRALRIPVATLLERLDYVRPSEALASIVARSDLEALVAKSPSLVIFDGVTEGMALHNLDPNKGPEVARFTQLVSRPFTDAGAAVVLVDHPVKDSSTRGRYAAGSAHKLNQVDGAAYVFELITLARRGGTGSSRLSIAKDRPGAVRGACEGKAAAVFVLESSADGDVGWRFEAPTVSQRPGEPWRPTALMGKVSRHLEQSDKPLSQRAIEVAVSGRSEYIRKAIVALVSEDYVASEGSDSRRLYRSVRPFAEGDSDA